MLFARRGFFSDQPAFWLLTAAKCFRKEQAIVFAAAMHLPLFEIHLTGQGLQGVVRASTGRGECDM